MLRRRLWSWRALLALVAAAALVGVVLAGGAGAASRAPAAAAANSVTYQDSTGEDPQALDIGTVVVSNDDAGLVTFEIRFANRGYRLDTDLLWVALDTDRDRTTGDPDLDGADWTLGFMIGTADLERWNGSDWVTAPSMRSVTSAVIESGLRLRVGSKEIGSPSVFDFWIGSLTFAGPEAEEPLGFDTAPDANKGVWRYEVKMYAKPVLRASKLTCKPDPPKAGKAMVARMTVKVTRAGQAELLGGKAKVVGVARVAGKKVVGKVAPTYRTGKVAVTFKVPQAAKGKVMRGYVKVTLEGVSVKRPFVEKVR